MPLEFEPVRGLFGKKNDIFAEHFSLDWCHLWPEHICQQLDLRTLRKLPCAQQPCPVRRAALPELQPSSVPLHCPWMDFAVFLTFAYLVFGGDFSSEQGFLGLFMAGIPVLSPELLLLAVGRGCINRHLTAVLWDWGELHSLTALIFQMFYFYMRADSLFVINVFNT